MSDWLTVEEASKKTRRSTHTIYSWIYESKRGRTDRRLDCIQVPYQGHGRGAEIWLVGEASLKAVDSLAPRERHSASKGGRHDGKDCSAKVFADRKKWIQDWVAEGKTLGRVKAVFDTSLHSEIEDLYWQAVAEYNRGVAARRHQY